MMTNLMKLTSATAMGALFAVPALAQNLSGPQGGQDYGTSYNYAAGSSDYGGSNQSNNQSDQGNVNRPPGIVGYGMYSHVGPEPNSLWQNQGQGEEQNQGQ